ncbi:MAG: chemotaxis protein CheA [Deltaproteobacteria bacterium]|nr:chemotaxis protein CheA [Deltaproteobacteria bacterium]
MRSARALRFGALCVAAPVDLHRLPMAVPIDLTTFIGEVDDLLEKVEASALALESHPDDAERMNELFRAFHTLKGSAGVVGLTSIARFTHHVESALDHVRSGALALSPALVQCVLAAKDHVAALLAAELRGVAVAAGPGDAIIARLAGLTANAADTATALVFAAVPAAATAPRAEVDYFIEFRPGPEIASMDVGADAIFDGLRGLGPCERLGGDPSDAGALAPWRFQVTTRRDVAEIHDVFIFVASAGELQIDQGMTMFVDDEPAPAPVAPALPSAAPSGAAASRVAPARSSAAARSTVRVSSERLDQLVKLIGELVITQSRLQQVHSQHAIAELAGPVEAFERLIGDLRDGVLGLRMVPIGTMFGRFHRLVHDLSADLAKDVELVTAGDDTELDKTVIDQLGDALLHILRNSMDHGLEAPGERIAAGKPARGTVRLAAAHEGAHVVITIADDGRGIDATAVRRKAEAQGLIAPDAVLSEQETLALIMRPGLSTSRAVTEVSGRGVGMDVVKRTIESLRGTIAISSRAGAGTTLRLTLPLTLAIIDGLLVEVDSGRFIMPMAAVMENLELTHAERCAHNGRNMIAVRGELVPYVRLRDLFALPDAAAAIECVVVVGVDGARVGLVVDRVVGLHQTVIQPLGMFYRGVEMFSGTTIMGDGRVAMILDLAGTVRRMTAASALSSYPGPQGTQ